MKIITINNQDYELYTSQKELGLNCKNKLFFLKKDNKPFICICYYKYEMECFEDLQINKPNDIYYCEIITNQKNKVTNISILRKFNAIIKYFCNLYNIQLLITHKNEQFYKKLKFVELFNTQVNEILIYKNLKFDIGDNVIITLKPYKGKLMKGKIIKILTTSANHSRGQKVQLDNNLIGRVIYVL